MYALCGGLWFVLAGEVVAHLAANADTRSGWQLALDGCFVALSTIMAFWILRWQLRVNATGRRARRQLELEERHFPLVPDLGQQLLNDLEASTANLKLAQRIAGIGSWEMELPRGPIRLSDETFRIFAVERAAFNHDFYDILSPLHPDDRPAMMLWLEALRADRSPTPIEFRALHPNGKVRDIRVEGQLVRGPAEQPVRIAGIVQDVTDLRAVERDLRDSEARYRALVEWSPEAIVVNRHGVVLYANPTAVALLRASSPLDILGKSFQEFIHRDHQRAAQEQLLRVHTVGEPLPSTESRFICCDGTEIDVEVSGTAIMFDGAPALRSAFRDIGEVKRATDALRRSEQGLREAERVARVGHWELCVRSNTIIMSHEMYRIWGHEPSTAPHALEGLMESVYPDDRAALRQAIAALLTVGMSDPLEYRVIRSDGSVRTVRATHGRSVRDEQGRITVLSGIIQDITEQKQAQRAAHDNEERLRLAAEAARQGIFDLDLQTGKTTVSPMYAAMLGYDPASFHESPEARTERMHPDDREPVARLFRAHVDGRRPTYRAEFRQRTRAGDWMWILSVGRVIERDGDGRPLRMLGTHTDISAIKETQAKLDVQVRRAKALLDLPRAAEWMDEHTFLQHGLTQVEELTGSRISFIHFVNEMDKSLELTAWSPRTIQRYCTSTMDGHASIPNAGVWADAVRLRRTVVCNAYDSQSARQGLPDGHPAMRRMLTVPVIEDGKVRMLTGVANREDDYAQADVQTVELLSHAIWRTVRRRRGDAALRASEASHRQLFAANPHPMWSYDQETLRFIDVNDAAVAHYGYSREEFLAMTIEDIRPERDLTRLHAQLSQSKDLDTVAAGFWRHRRKDGTIIAVEISSHTVTFDGRRARVVLAHDVTEQRRARALIRESEERLRNTLALAGMAAWEMDFASGRVTRTALYDRLFGVPWRDEYDRAQFRSAMHPDERPADESTHFGRTSASPDDRFVHEFRVLWPDGSAHWLASAGQVTIRDDHGAAVLARGVLMEITERKEAETRVHELHAALADHATDLAHRVAVRTAELQSANKELEAFASAVSHDLRAPLRAMDGFSTVLLSRYHEQFDAQGRHYLERIQQAAEHMSDLIDDLLELSRITRGELHRQCVDLGAIASEIAAELRMRDPQRNAQFTLAASLVADADARLMRIALRNLLENAWKFTVTREQAHIEFGVDPIESGRPVRYFVRDNGVGFDMAYAHKLFTPFQRLHTTNEFPGTG
ncbi:MAG: PAS domain S-box protein, partial [Gemmatimonas sp.]